MHILAKIKFIKFLDVPNVVKNVDENRLAARSDFRIHSLNRHILLSEVDFKIGRFSADSVCRVR